MAVEAFSQHSKNETETLDSQRHLSISTDNCKVIMSFYIFTASKNNSTKTSTVFYIKQDLQDMDM